LEQKAASWFGEKLAKIKFTSDSAILQRKKKKKGKRQNFLFLYISRR